MRFKTHFTLGLLLYFLLDYFFGLSILNGLLIIVFSILPDIDLHTSYIGRRIKVISHILELFFKHRGFFHSLWPVVFLYFVLFPFGLEIILIGYIGHLLLDILNKKGIALLWPFLKIKGHFKTGGLLDFVLFLVFVSADLIFLLIFLLKLNIINIILL